MSDWAVGQGLAALYGGPNKIAREDASMQKMIVFDGVMKQKRVEEEMAQLKEQQYNEQISKFADELLAPDRDRINNKAKLLSQRVRQEIANQGGDMRKFFASGGHTIMADYKNGIINSQEASVYLNNKKNTEFILKVQQAGKGHLLSPVDLDNFKRYGETGQGEITYSGMLNEIEMPDAQNYDYGAKIPARDILMTNYAKIYGNYKMMYPDSAEPTTEALEAFTDQMYQGRGAEWRRKLSIDQEANRHKEALAKTQADLMAEILKAQGKTGKQATDANGNPIPGGDSVVDPFEKQYIDLIPAQVADAFSLTPSQFGVEDLEKGANLSETLLQMSEDIPLDEIAGTDHNLNEKGWLFDAKAPLFKKGNPGNDVQKALENKYAPVQARRLFKGLQLEVADAFFNLEGEKAIDKSSRKYKDYRPSDNSFLADGKQAVNNSDVIDYESYIDRGFEVKDIVTVQVGKDKDGKRMIAMDRIDGNKVHKDSRENLKNQFASSTLNNQMAIVMESEYGDRFYELIDPRDAATMNKITKKLGPLADNTSMSEDKYNRAKRMEQKQVAVSKTKKETEAFWSQIHGNPKVFENVYYDGLALSSTGQYTGKHKNLMKAYYASLAQMGGLTSPNDVMEITKRSDMNIQNDINEWDDKGFKYENKTLKELIKSGSYGDREILLLMYNFAQDKSPQDLPMLEKWINNVDYLNSTK